MASPTIHPAGFGASAGSDLAISSRLYSSGTVYFVGSANGGSDAYAGTDRLKPLATLNQAITNSSAGDIICLLANHAETMTGAVGTVKARTAIVGEGTGSSRPTLACGAAVSWWSMANNGVVIDNIIVAASTVAPTTYRMQVSGIGTTIMNCKFQFGALDTVTGLNLPTGAAQIRIRDCEFVSTATSVAAQPASAITVANAMTDLWLENVTLDGGTTGWSNPYAFVGTGAVTGLRAFGLRLLGGSDMTMATGTTGYIGESTDSGSVRITWAA